MNKPPKTKLTLDDLGDFLSKLAEKSELVYWLSSPDFKKIQYISPAYEKTWGRSREELYTNPEIWITFLHPQDAVKRHPIEEMAEKVARLGEAARFSENYRIIRPNGEVRWIMDNGFPVFDSNGNCCGVTGVAVDVTQEKMHEQELRKAKNQAEAANRAKTEFIANMSHDIRTPLSGVVGMAQLLEESVVQPEQKQFARWIYDCGHQLLSMLNGILDVVSADNVSEDDIHQETFNLYQCVKDIVQIERPTTILKNIDLKVSIDQKVPEYIVSDRTKIHRILLNLLGNAIKFTEKGHVGITINVVSHKKKTMLRFRVIDTGIGIPLEHHDKVFDRFFRASPSYKGIYTGHGIGLHIAQSYVNQLNGEIKLTSKEGIGTTFRFDLPLKLPTKKAIQAYIESIPAIPNLPEPSFNTKIAPVHNEDEETAYLLLVEDNPVALKVLEAIAEKMGCHFISAANGEDALELATTNSFDLIITDIGLPKMSGYQFSKQFRHWEKAHRKGQIPIIGLTAHGEKKAKNECMASGMSDVYTKPVNLIVLKHEFRT